MTAHCAEWPCCSWPTTQVPTQSERFLNSGQAAWQCHWWNARIQHTIKVAAAYCDTCSNNAWVKGPQRSRHQGAWLGPVSHVCCLCLASLLTEYISCNYKSKNNFWVGPIPAWTGRFKMWLVAWKKYAALFSNHCCNVWFTTQAFQPTNPSPWAPTVWLTTQGSNIPGIYHRKAPIWAVGWRATWHAPSAL